jgi:hypothetical protein
LRSIRNASSVANHARAGSPAQPIDAARENFERLTAATALRVVRFWQVRQDTDGAANIRRSRVNPRSVAVILRSSRFARAPQSLTQNAASKINEFGTRFSEVSDSSTRNVPDDWTLCSGDLSFCLR